MIIELTPAEPDGLLLDATVIDARVTRPAGATTFKGTTEVVRTIRFRFRVVAGPFAGTCVERTLSGRYGPGTTLYSWMRILDPPAPPPAHAYPVPDNVASRFTLEHLLGRPARIAIETIRRGPRRTYEITDIFPPAESAPDGPPARTWTIDRGRLRLIGQAAERAT